MKQTYLQAKQQELREYEAAEAEIKRDLDQIYARLDAAHNDVTRLHATLPKQPPGFANEHPDVENALAAATELSSQARRNEERLADVRQKIGRLLYLLGAKDSLKETLGALQQLKADRRAIAEKRVKAEARIVELDARIHAAVDATKVDMKQTAQALLESDDPLPDCFHPHQTPMDDVRSLEAMRAEISAHYAKLGDQDKGLVSQIEATLLAARRLRVVVEEIAFNETLPSVMPVFARMAAARRLEGGRHDNRMEVEPPPDMVEGYMNGYVEEIEACLAD